MDIEVGRCVLPDSCGRVCRYAELFGVEDIRSWSVNIFRLCHTRCQLPHSRSCHILYLSRALVDWTGPYYMPAQSFDVIKLVDDAQYMGNTIAIDVFEARGIDVIDRAFFPPRPLDLLGGGAGVIADDVLCRTGLLSVAEAGVISTE